MAKLALQDANAIVTGASRGIGPYIARELAARGMRVALVARSTHELEKLAADLTASGAVAVALAGDVTSREDRERVVAVAEQTLGPVDVLVNNAGGDPQREYHNLSEEEIEDVLLLNLHAPLLLARLLLPAMLERGRGHVVNVSSMAGRTSFPYTEAYGAAKDGLIAFTRIWRGDYRARGVSASTLILGPVGEAGVGARTADEVGLKLPPFLVSPARIGKATVRAIEGDKAELTLMPGPGKLLRALMDRFPGMGPAMNRVAGVDKTMKTVADHRERKAPSHPAALSRRGSEGPA
jgi:short-subunit dehydrogenase